MKGNQHPAMSSLNLQNLKKAYRYCKKNGIVAAYDACRERLTTKTPLYEKRHVPAEVLERQRKAGFTGDPLVSVLVPAYCTDPGYFEDMVRSLLDQSYENWELIIADASPDEAPLRTIAYGFADKRIHYYHLDGNAGISENTNRALEQASGRYVALLDHDDFLEPDALYHMLMVFETNPQALVAYSDEDKVSGDGTRFYEPNFKPKFNLDLILSNNYICHFLMMEAGLIKRLGFRAEYDGAQDHDLILRAAGTLYRTKGAIVHVPEVLYHWRCHEASTAENPESKRYAYEAGLRAVTDLIRKMGWKASVRHAKHLGFFDVTFEDIFRDRKDIAAYGGSLVRGGRIVGGALDEAGNVLYAGLPARFSGYMNRASLKQDVYAIDTSCMVVRPELADFFHANMEKTEDTKEAGLLFAREVQKRGLLILWDPAIKKRI
ncbi:MAG: glycosyltransferase [Lachnospiraceae bacterium]|nr:glycosyltransferase [Lachnospiraceae bacterium]